MFASKNLDELYKILVLKYVLQSNHLIFVHNWKMCVNNKQTWIEEIFEIVDKVSGRKEGWIYKITLVLWKGK